MVNEYRVKGLALLLGLCVLQGCSGEANIVVSAVANDSDTNSTPNESLSAEQTTSLALRNAISSQSAAKGMDWLLLPNSDDLSAIPQDPNNPLTDEKITLGRFLFHDTGLASAGNSSESFTWSCASCHHAEAGFKAGVVQGIGEGGIGFGGDGSERTLLPTFDAMAENDASNKPDIQPLTSPSILNSAFQDVMLWNGQFGNSTNGSVNDGLPASILAPSGTPKVQNARQLAGLETQAIAGIGVHRLDVSDSSVLQTNENYQELFQSAYPAGSSDVLGDSGKAIAAYERTVLANRAPFQQWLSGDESAMNESQLRGGLLFFGYAGCADCHRGPALSSEIGADETALFMAIGFNDFKPEIQENVHGMVTQADKQGRGGFTTDAADRYKFKIPQLYNLKDTNVFGHGASFSSIREVLEYKSAGVAQNTQSVDYLDSRFVPLNLSERQLNDLEAFLADALYDPELQRYQPDSVPSGHCVVVDPQISINGRFCP